MEPHWLGSLERTIGTGETGAFPGFIVVSFHLAKQERVTVGRQESKEKDTVAATEPPEPEKP